MTIKYLVLTEEIRKELEALAEVVAHIEIGLIDLTKADDDSRGYIIDSLALSLQSFYSGFENVFRRIATYVDGELPTGERWHIDLLEQMCVALPEIRPKVISESTQQELREFLSFRHAIRNIYVFDIASEPVIALANSVPTFFSKVKAELEAFCVFLKTVGNGS